MDQLIPIVALCAGALIGGIITWLFLRQKAAHAAQEARASAEISLVELQTELKGRGHAITELRARLTDEETLTQKLRDQVMQLRARDAQWSTTVQKERQQTEEKLKLVEDATAQLSNAFKALSADALKTNNSAFLDLAKTTLETFQEAAKGDLEKRQVAIDAMVKPVGESLKKVDEKLQDIETKRTSAYASLTEQVKALGETQISLRNETGNLVKALRRPDVRGRWGEIQLRRVVEMAGMIDHCDFYEQQSVTTEDGRLRPDLLVRLPGQKNIVVDSKVPLDAFIDAVETDDEELRRQKQKDHARLLRNHLQSLGKKSYHLQFDATPDFVVMFLPGDGFYALALEHDPSLIEIGVENNVLIATPTSLIGLLRAISCGWRQESLAKNAHEISELGKELYKRLSQLGEHLTKLGARLNQATNAYNAAIGSMESRVLVTARKFEGLGISAPESQLEGLTPVEQTPRALMAPELTPSTVLGGGD